MIHQVINIVGPPAWHEDAMCQSVMTSSSPGRLKYVTIRWVNIVGPPPPRMLLQLRPTDWRFNKIPNCNYHIAPVMK